MNDRELLTAFSTEMARRGYTVEQAAHAIGVGRSTFFHWQKTGIVSKRGRSAMAAFIPSQNEVGDPTLQVIIDAWSRISAADRVRLSALALDMAEKNNYRSQSADGTNGTVLPEAVK